MNTPQWIDILKEKPKKECMCYVICRKGTLMDTFLALYDPHADWFCLYEPERSYTSRFVCLDVTHYIPLPDASKAEKR